VSPQHLSLTLCSLPTATIRHGALTPGFYFAPGPHDCLVLLLSPLDLGAGTADFPGELAAGFTFPATDQFIRVILGRNTLSLRHLGCIRIFVIARRRGRGIVWRNGIGTC
jgi:hypothetical protein